MTTSTRNERAAHAAEPEDDDVPVGRLWSRKEIFLLLGGAATSLTFLAGCGGGSGGGTVSGTSTATTSTSSTASSGTTSVTGTTTATGTTSTSTGTTTGSTSTGTSSSGSTSSGSTSSSGSSITCVATPELTEGPYWVDEKLNRSDIRTDPTTGVAKSGTPLVLNLVVANVNGACAAISDAQVDIWHCDANGLYSDESANNTVGQKFLRGYQTTDANGTVQFTTIYPGWYSGRSVHIHFRVRATINGKSYNFTSQLFFDDTLTDTVFTQSPYSSRGTRTTRNASDNIYKSQMQMAFVQSSEGFTTTFVIGLSV